MALNRFAARRAPVRPLRGAAVLLALCLGLAHWGSFSGGFLGFRRRAKAAAEPAKRFINDKENVVMEANDGLIASTPNVARLDGYPDAKVVVRTDWDKDAGEVAVISGGGSGHEPFSAGFVGKGMLTAAVCGSVFASPSQDAILAAIVAVTGRAGAVLIVLNYTGDRFNFGIAAARAKNEYGLDVRIIIVGDDVAIPDSKQPRGLMGTVYTVKMAGAAANNGLALDKVEAQARAVAEKSRSLGVSFSSCTLPGAAKGEERMENCEMEVGLGVHGEPGVEKMKRGTASEIVELISTRLMKTITPGKDVAMMVGNLGSVPPVEMSIVVGELLKRIPAKLVIGPGMFLTSLDMNGIQVTLLELDSEFMFDGIAAPTTAMAWPGAVVPHEVQKLPYPLKPAPSLEEGSPKRNMDIEALMRKAAEALVKAETELNDIDVKVGDGDCGSTMRESAEQVLSLLGKVSTADPKITMTAIGRALNLVGGSSGVLLSVMFTTIAGSLEEDMTWSRAAVAPGFVEGVATLMNVGGAKVGMRTMVDVLKPVSDALAGDMPSKEVIALAEKMTADTANILSTNFGRSQYLSAHSLKGYPDPGCIAASMVFKELLS